MHVVVVPRAEARIRGCPFVAQKSRFFPFFSAYSWRPAKTRRPSKFELPRQVQQRQVQWFRLRLLDVRRCATSSNERKSVAKCIRWKATKFHLPNARRVLEIWMWASGFAWLGRHVSEKAAQENRRLSFVLVHYSCEKNGMQVPTERRCDFRLSSNRIFINVPARRFSGVVGRDRRCGKTSRRRRRQPRERLDVGAWWLHPNAGKSRRK